MTDRRYHTDANGEIWINLNDLGRLLNDDIAVETAAAMMKVAKDRGDTPHNILRYAIAHAILEGFNLYGVPGGPDSYERTNP